MSNITFRQWPHDQTYRLRELWWDGKSPKECARILGAASPRAVKDKVDREGFIRNPAIKKVAKGELAQPVRRENGDFITMENVRQHECRWMFAEQPTADAPLCGRPAFGSSWCAGHRIRCYSKQAAAC